MPSLWGKEITSKLDMNTIRAKMGEQHGVAKSARFAVQILAPTGLSSAMAADLLYLCEVAEFPGRTFMNSDIRYYGPSVKFPFQTVYEDVNFTFLCRNDSNERKFFDDWQQLINPISTFDFNYKSSYQTRINIFQFDERFEAKYVITLIDAYPIQISPQPVTWADDNFQRLAVTFTYTKWGRNTIDYNE